MHMSGREQDRKENGSIGGERKLGRYALYPRYFYFSGIFYLESVCEGHFLCPILDERIRASTVTEKNCTGEH